MNPDAHVRCKSNNIPTQQQQTNGRMIACSGTRGKFTGAEGKLLYIAGTTTSTVSSQLRDNRLQDLT